MGFEKGFRKGGVLDCVFHDFDGCFERDHVANAHVDLFVSWFCGDCGAYGFAFVCQMGCSFARFEVADDFVFCYAYGWFSQY